MGGCLSHWKNNNSINVLVDDEGKQMMMSEDMVNVITGKGYLRHYTVPVTASQVIYSESESETETTSSSNNYDWFICNSDSLYYDEYIQPLDLEEELEGGGQMIYFMLPTTKLHYPLTGSDMAALAVKATLALQHIYTPHHLKPHKQQQQQQQRNITNKARISPFLLADDGQQNQLTLKKAEDVFRKQKSLSNSHKSSSSNPAAPGVSKSMRKLQRYSSTRAKMAVRSFRLRLTTIYEGSVLQFYS